jgi:putative nucleotidyltransferase with HDIG domain
MELLTQIHSLIGLSHKTARRERFDDLVGCFTTMLGIRDPGLLAHSQRVAKLAEQLAYRMGMPLAVATEVRAGALLHDVGKLCLDGPGDGPEGGTATVPRHAEWGDRMFANFHRPLARAIIRLHHDGAAPGSALAQVEDRQVRQAVQIVAVCNRFDNLVQAGPQGPDLIPRALERLEAEAAAKGWDPEVCGKLAELTRTFGSGLFTVFAAEGGGGRVPER